MSYSPMTQGGVAVRPASVADASERLTFIRKVYSPRLISLDGARQISSSRRGFLIRLPATPFSTSPRIPREQGA